MNNAARHRLALALCLVAASTAPALAQPPGEAPYDSADASIEVAVPAPAPAPRVAVAAPQNEDWSNVSHINGTPVKVGERNDYLNNGYKKVNLSSNPIGWMFGF